MEKLQNAHIFIRPNPQTDDKCQMCRLPPAKGIFRIEVPYNEETAKVTDVRICKYCAGGLIDMLIKFRMS